MGTDRWVYYRHGWSMLVILAPRRVRRVEAGVSWVWSLSWALWRAAIMGMGEGDNLVGKVLVLQAREDLGLIPEGHWSATLPYLASYRLVFYKSRYMVSEKWYLRFLCDLQRYINTWGYNCHAHTCIHTHHIDKEKLQWPKWALPYTD